MLLDLNIERSVYQNQNNYSDNLATRNTSELEQHIATHIVRTAQHEAPELAPMIQRTYVYEPKIIEERRIENPNRLRIPEPITIKQPVQVRIQPVIEYVQVGPAIVGELPKPVLPEVPRPVTFPAQTVYQPQTQQQVIHTNVQQTQGPQQQVNNYSPQHDYQVQQQNQEVNELKNVVRQLQLNLREKEENEKKIQREQQIQLQQIQKLQQANQQPQPQAQPQTPVSVNQQQYIPASQPQQQIIKPPPPQHPPQQQPQVLRPPPPQYVPQPQPQVVMPPPQYVPQQQQVYQQQYNDSDQQVKSILSKLQQIDSRMNGLQQKVHESEQRSQKDRELRINTENLSPRYDPSYQEKESRTSPQNNTNEYFESNNEMPIQGQHQHTKVEYAPIPEEKIYYVEERPVRVLREPVLTEYREYRPQSPITRRSLREVIPEKGGREEVVTQHIAYRPVEYDDHYYDNNDFIEYTSDHYYRQPEYSTSTQSQYLPSQYSDRYHTSNYRTEATPGIVLRRKSYNQVPSYQQQRSIY